MENVSLRMVIVQPDLMSDLTPPPATESVIDNIPTVCLSQQDVGKGLWTTAFLTLYHVILDFNNPEKEAN